MTTHSNDSFLLRLHEVMSASGLTQKKLGELSGISATTISRWKKPNAPTPDYKSIKAIADVVGCNPDWLETGKGPKYKTKKLRASFNQDLGSTDEQAATSISLDHEKNEFSLTEMITMTMEILQSKTVYKAALASNIRAFHAGITMEKEMTDVKEEIEEMRAQMARVEQMLLSLGAELPEKKDRAANS